MTYDDLVEFIREDGCRVYVYKNKDEIYGGCHGTFSAGEDNPIICVVTKDVERKKRVETLLHEYGHYLQYKDGFMQYLDGIIDSYDMLEKWIKGKIELTELEKTIICNTMLTIEYDAEKRGYEQGCYLEPDDWDGTFYLRGAAAYMDSIKWQFATRISNYDALSRRKYSPSILTLEELYAPLTEAKVEDMSMHFRKL